MKCDCEETKLRDMAGNLLHHWHPPRFHDCGYIEERNAMIPEAEARADWSMRYDDPLADDFGTKWTKCFSNAMDALARGL